jgi:hypothetical protein
VAGTISVEQFTSALINSTPKPLVPAPARAVAAAHVSETQGHSKSSMRRQGLAIKMHNVLRLPSTGADQKNWRKQSHGKENLEESKEARSHQAVDRIPKSLKLKSVCKFLLVKRSGHIKTGGNKNMAKKSLKKAKKLEATKPLTFVAGRR